MMRVMVRVMIVRVVVRMRRRRTGRTEAHALLGDPLRDALGRELDDQVDDPTLVRSERARARVAARFLALALARERLDALLERLEPAEDLVHSFVHVAHSTLRVSADHSRAACNVGCTVTPAPASTR